MITDYEDYNETEDALSEGEYYEDEDEEGAEEEEEYDLPVTPPTDFTTTLKPGLSLTQLLDIPRYIKLEIHKRYGCEMIIFIRPSLQIPSLTITSFISGSNCPEDDQIEVLNKMTEVLEHYDENKASSYMICL